MAQRQGSSTDRQASARGEVLPRHVWLVEEATNSRKPPMIALLLELRCTENDGPAHSRAAEPHWRGLVAVAYPGGGMRVWWERIAVLTDYESWSNCEPSGAS